MEILKILLKKSCKNTIIINNNNFIINYSRNLGRPMFSAYDIFPEQLTHLKFGRKKFIRDKRLDLDGIYQLDSSSSIFNGCMSRGHLCPSFLMSHDKTKNGSWASSYLMSNIIPQNKDFNCGSWQKLEIDTFKLIKKISQPVKVIVGALNLDYTNNKNLIWFDEKKQFNYVIPNIMYQIIITKYEIMCYIGFNDSRQKIQSIKLDELLNLI